MTARNLVASELRRMRSDPTEVEVLERALAEVTPDPSPPDPLLRDAIADCHEHLPPRPKQALEARGGAGGAEPDRVLAARLAMTLNVFLQNVTRARRLLLECLERRGIDVREVVA